MGMGYATVGLNVSSFGIGFEPNQPTVHP